MELVSLQQNIKIIYARKILVKYKKKLNNIVIVTLNDAIIT